MPETARQTSPSHSYTPGVNLILLDTGDFIAPDRVRLSGRRADHVRETHRAEVGDRLTVGVLGGKVGSGKVRSLGGGTVELDVSLTDPPPPALPLLLLLALPRPKVLNRLLVGVSSMGVKEIVLFNCWRVERSYWSSPRLSEENIRLQLMLGLEQAKDTVLPTVRFVRRFTPFVEDELPELIRGWRCLLAHPGASDPLPHSITERVALAIGPEGGFIENEIRMFSDRGFEPVHLGPRPLRVEHAVPAILGRLFEF
jgi:16S rRNA (uracil1498-N3)-methyltransferase